MGTYRKSKKSMLLFRMRTATAVTALCVFILAGASNADTYTDSSPQTTPGQNFVFTFSPVGPWSGGNGTFTVHARGDYSVEHPTEFLNWDIDGLISDIGAPTYGTVITEFSHDDVEWEQSYTINGGLMAAITSDSVINISVDLPSNIDIIGVHSFVEVELTYNASGSQCQPPPEPNNPDPCDGTGTGTTEVPVDTCLSWSDSAVTPPPLPSHVVIEDFEDGGMTEYTIRGIHIVKGDAAHDGSLGLESDGADWAYRYDSQVLVGQGDTISFWVCVRSDGRAYCGFGASSAGTYSIVAAPNTNELLLQRNIGFGHTDIGSVSHAWQLNKWYLMEVQWEFGGNMIGRLYDSDGSTLLKTVTATDNTYTSGGIAFRSFGNVSNYFDTVQRSGPSALTTQLLLEALAFGPVFLEARDPADAIGWDEQNGAFIFESQTVVTGVQIGNESLSIKEEAAPQIISTYIAVMNQGLPGCGDYSFIDSDETGGPSFDWIDISTTGTNLNLSDDTSFFPINLPFSFDFYGTNYNQVAVGSNGHVYFESQYLGLNNVCIPGSNSYGVHRFIAVYWDDLVPSGSDNVYYQIVGSSPNRKLVVQWHNVRHYPSTDRVTVQAQLFESSGDILLLYADPSLKAGVGATVGIQSDPSCGLGYLCNQAGLHSNLAILFTRRDPCPTTWDVYLGTDPGAMELIAANLSDPCCCPPSVLEGGTTYYWQVIAKNLSAETPGNLWSFETEGGDPPDCSTAVPSICEIWPPRHGWVDIEILDVNDPDGDPVTITITGIAQDEPVVGYGSGNTCPDGMGVGTSVASIRSERSGQGNGRIYEISFEADDGTGNSCTGTVNVCVPHDKRQGRECINDGPLYDSTATELFRADLNNDGIINALDLSILTKYWLASYELED